jgi:hypothetical protein
MDICELVLSTMTDDVDMDFGNAQDHSITKSTSGFLAAARSSLLVTIPTPWTLPGTSRTQ